MLDYFLRYSYFHIPNYALGALSYTCFGVFLLDIFFRPGSSNPIYRAFHRIVDPYFRLLAPITPGFMPPFLVPLYAAFWPFLLRAIFYIVLSSYDLAPTLSEAQK